MVLMVLCIVRGIIMAKSIPTKFFDMLPLPIAVLKINEESLNQKIVYLNTSWD